MSDTIEKWGLIPNKTFVLKFPDFLDENLYSHFIRGYFDGDGTACIYHDKTRENTRITAAIMSSIEFCDGLGEYLKNIGINFHVNMASGHENNKVVRSSDPIEVKKFVDFIYKNADLYMKRKYNKFINWFN